MQGDVKVVLIYNKTNSIFKNYVSLTSASSTIFSVIIMAAISDPDLYGSLQEKGNPTVERSSSDKSGEGAGKEGYDEKAAAPVNVRKPNSSDDSSSDSINEVFDSEAIDPVLAKKMALVNKAIDKIGMTSFQWKMLFLNGFGYAVDSVCST